MWTPRSSSFPRARPLVSRFSPGRSGGNATNMSPSVPVRWVPFATDPTRMGFASQPRAARVDSTLERRLRTTSARRASSSALGRIRSRTFDSTSTGGTCRGPDKRPRSPDESGEEPVQARGRDGPVDDELDRDRGEEEPHDPPEGVHPGAADPPEDDVRVVEEEERREDSHEDPREDEHLVERVRDGGRHVDHDRRDRARTREEGDAEGHDAHALPLEALLPLSLPHLLPRPSPREHLEAHAEKEAPARDLERGDREPEAREDPVAEDGEDAEGRDRDEAAPRDDVPLLPGGHLLPEDGEERHDPEGVDDREDGGHGGGSERHIDHGSPWRKAEGMTPSASSSTSSSRPTRTRRAAGWSPSSRTRPR